MVIKGELRVDHLEILSSQLPVDLMGPAAQAYAEQCETALRQIPECEHRYRVIVLTHLTVALANTASITAQPRAQEAAELAATVQDPVTTAYALVARGFSSPMPHLAQQRVAWGREILTTAALHNQPQLASAGYFLLLLGLLETGDIRSLDRELTEQGEISRQFPWLYDSAPSHWFRCLRIILDGDIPAALQYINQQMSQVTEPENSQAFALYASQMGIVRWMRGEIDTAEDDFLAARRTYPDQAIWPASLCWLWLRQGRRAAAESIFQTFPPLDEIPRDQYWLCTMVTIAEIAVHLGTEEFAHQVRDTLLPLAHNLVPIGVGVAFWGTVARTLGLLEERLGLPDAALEHLTYAVEITNRIGAHAWLAEAQIELAEFAVRNGLSHIPAHSLLLEAESAASARGFVGLRKRARHRPRICVLGRFEVTARDRTSPEWTSRKARDLLKLLVAFRGGATSREVFMDILWPGIAPDKLNNRLSVAIHTVRRALDPGRAMPTQHYVQFEDESIWLNCANLDIDAEEFLALAKSPNPESKQQALQMYTGPAFSEEPYADWAINLREAVEQARIRCEESL